MWAFAPEPLFRLLLRDPHCLPKAYSTPLLIHKAPPLGLTVAQKLHAALLLEKWHGCGEVGAAKKGVFKRTLGCPWNIHMLSDSCLSPFLLSMAKEREKCKLQKEVPTPTLLYPPTSAVSPPILLQSLLAHSVCTSFPSSTVATKMSNYCKNISDYCATHFQPLGRDARMGSREHNSVLCVFGKGRTPVVIFYPSLFAIYYNICQRKWERQVCANRVCTSNFFKNLKRL